ncbi:MAG: DUF4258 domain-containing protein [Candidatus Loosdrechtia sp.]|uniref:DUF4258 domain-containing protein n=1 Tax=Candidatus Loosdrechtia sp. TaxID=3101272 RepID=UPI003A65C60A|nr:MAG: DUF4258 domain-containing protein [Candidatus Jettenia sp. AMX2]
MKPIKYSRHARRRMKEREITKEEAEITINEPEFTEPGIKSRTNAFKCIGSRFLRVTFKDEPDHILVITAAMRKKPFRRQ